MTVTVTGNQPGCFADATAFFTVTETGCAALAHGKNKTKLPSNRGTRIDTCFVIGYSDGSTKVSRFSSSGVKDSNANIGFYKKSEKKKKINGGHFVVFKV